MFRVFVGRGADFDFDGRGVVARNVSGELHGISPWASA